MCGATVWGSPWGLSLHNWGNGVILRGEVRGIQCLSREIKWEMVATVDGAETGISGMHRERADKGYDCSGLVWGIIDTVWDGNEYFGIQGTCF